MRKIFIVSSVFLVLALSIIVFFNPDAWWLFVIVAPPVLLGIYDLVQKRHTILRNFPVIGHFRYMLESVGPEMRQYFEEANTEGRPFTRL